MSSKKSKKPTPSVLIIPAVFLLCVLTVILVLINPGSERYANAVTPFFMLQPDAVTEEAVPGYAGIRRNYTFTIPEADSATTTGSRLTAYLRHTIAEVSVEDSELVFDNSEADAFHIGKTPGNYWLSIPVRPVFAGKTVHVTLTPVYDSVSNEQPMFMVITRDTLLGMIVMPQDRLLLVLSVAAIAAGLFLALFSLAMPLEKRDKRRVFYLGLVTVFAGLWKVCGLPVVPLLLDFAGIQKGIWFTGALSYLFMMILSLRLLTDLREEGAHRTGSVCFYIASAAAALLIVLQITGIAELHQMLLWYGIGMAALHLISILGKKPAASELLWLLPFFLSLGIDLVIYLVTGSMRNAPAFLLWILANLLLRGLGFVNAAIKRERALRKKEEELRDAKVRAMMNQIRPHFIYNVLTSIYVLCKEDPELASQVIQDFTAYLQANFTAISATNLISFGDELQHTKAYVAVESLRYADKLTVDYDIRHSAFRLPPLTLQPLVENAIKHCLGKGIGPEHITIRTFSENDHAVITVKDNGPGIDPDDADSEVHVGLRNVKERLKLMCGGSLEYSSEAGNGTEVTITIPRN